MLRWPDAVAMLAGLAMVAVAAGCQAVGPGLAENVARAVAHYCAEPAAARAVYRGAVDELTAPNAIRVTCAKDEPPAVPAGP